MYAGLKQPRGDRERYVTPARAAAEETRVIRDWTGLNQTGKGEIRDWTGLNQAGNGEIRDWTGLNQAGKGEIRDWTGLNQAGNGEIRDWTGLNQAGKGEFRDCTGLKLVKMPLCNVTRGNCYSKAYVFN